MFTFRNSPCMTEQYGYPLQFRSIVAEPRTYQKIYLAPTPRINYDVDETPNNYVITLKKSVPQNLVYQAIQEHVMQFRESYRPRCELVSDFFGNRYYVQESVSEEQLLREAMENIDMERIGKELARDAFENYYVSLDDGGRQLRIESQQDRFAGGFELTHPCHEAFAYLLEMTEDCNATMKIVLNKIRTPEYVRIPVNIQYIPVREELQREPIVRTKNVLSGNNRDAPKTIRITPKQINHSTKSADATTPRIIRIKPAHGDDKDKKLTNSSREENVSATQHSKDADTEIRQEQPEQTELKESQPGASEKQEQTTDECALVSDSESESASKSSSRSHSVTLENVDDEEIQRWRASMKEMPSFSAVVENNSR
ncbi:HGL154Cp [Eremothecium sinecaudum]|uniref:HGL154Cp n=1 Tax=Eremothecium sinecaudum TaxID=45286 RepID=A0A109V027_9SACH|nr:HGL154Cp [Eremothecium sinecaudum]AMD22186.1 HGL154Cp [Eremothecium sinecaudum]